MSPSHLLRFRPILLLGFLFPVAIGGQITAVNNQTDSRKINSQVAAQIKPAEEKSTFATRREFSKGGIGMLADKLFVVVRSKRTEKNELIVDSASGARESWYGKSVAEPEVVFFYEGQIWSYEGNIWSRSRPLPQGFDLSRAIVISFEKDKVRFFDFEKENGGYYSRIWD
jgi:hypothetical protein